MPSDLYRKDLCLDWVYPPFLERHLELKARCRARGASYLSTCLLRSVTESNLLYAKYRAGGPRAAPGGESSHNFGLAADEALIIAPSPKRVVRWDPGDFDILGEEAGKLGLHWGHGYGDDPHVSWPGFVSAQELAPLLDIWLKSKETLLLPKLQEVWQYVTMFGPTLPPFQRTHP